MVVSSSPYSDWNGIGERDRPGRSSRRPAGWRGTQNRSRFAEPYQADQRADAFGGTPKAAVGTTAIPGTYPRPFPESGAGSSLAHLHPPRFAGRRLERSKLQGALGERALPKLPVRGPFGTASAEASWRPGGTPLPAEEFRFPPGWQRGLISSSISIVAIPLGKSGGHNETRNNPCRNTHPYRRCAGLAERWPGTWQRSPSKNRRA